MFDLALEPEKLGRYRGEYRLVHEDICTMCGKIYALFIKING